MVTRIKLIMRISPPILLYAVYEGGGYKEDFYISSYLLQYLGMESGWDLGDYVCWSNILILLKMFTVENKFRPVVIGLLETTRLLTKCQIK